MDPADHSRSLVHVRDDVVLEVAVCNQSGVQFPEFVGFYCAADSGGLAGVGSSVTGGGKDAVQNECSMSTNSC